MDFDDQDDECDDETEFDQAAFEARYNALATEYDTLNRQISLNPTEYHRLCHLEEVLGAMAALYND